ncbi:translational GTPase TypA [Kiritimatiella glycovorans]|uniref:Large ribosomal subunit assembly factor BipA n=1 Tax=Kiritimatiella glycovorans TaxID=1307763 RepID=A0A0G3EKC0_9BACT|nr:translational GTPase TypA [Kiritimatiella glycovorans]AKJ65265.1 Tyrosine phosphorylated protein A [Kiritimatiella glycovorans]
MNELRNIAIIAHVDHGKTTLVDQIMRQVRLFRENEQVRECFLDSNDLERERGITILSKNISVRYEGVKINLIDTPGHSDFGGQVERVLKLADGVLLLVDAADGPMPQTRFVLKKALELDLQPIVVINKIDKPDARPDVVLERVFDLFVELDASNEQLDFPHYYASGRDGWAAQELEDARESLRPLLDGVIGKIPAPEVHEGPVQFQVASIDYNSFVGRIGIGRVYRGTLRTGMPLTLIRRNGDTEPAQLKQLLSFEGLERRETERVPCGELCAVVGMEDIDIGDTVADAEHPESLPFVEVDEPTVAACFGINDSPFFGRDGTYVTSRHLRERLMTEVQKDVALRVRPLADDRFEVSGRGTLHLSILIENMRREGYEMSVSRPEVIWHERDGVREEPFEVLTVDVPSELSGKIIEQAGSRRGEMVAMEPAGARVLLTFHIPTRGCIGLRSRLLTASSGEAIIAHRFSHYAPYAGEVPLRNSGVLISMQNGPAVSFALDALQSRGEFFVEAGEECYEGMIVGEHCLETDLIVNVQKTKKLTNVRAAGSDRNMKIAPPRRLSLEESLEYIAADELLEVTPKAIRMRKKLLKEHERKRAVSR